jgi:UDP-N-acetylmuramoyl-tripeptide--D-alanyl-D-alanine ligase
MLELGSLEDAAHREVGQRCAQTVQLLVTVGERARLIGAAAQEAGLPEAAVRHVPNNAAAIALLGTLLQEGDTLLIKGSRGMAMEEIVRALEVSA